MDQQEYEIRHSKAIVDAANARRASQTQQQPNSLIRLRDKQILGVIAIVAFVLWGLDRFLVERGWWPYAIIIGIFVALASIMIPAPFLQHSRHNQPPSR